MWHVCERTLSVRDVGRTFAARVLQFTDEPHDVQVRRNLSQELRLLAHQHLVGLRKSICTATSQKRILTSSVIHCEHKSLCSEHKYTVRSVEGEEVGTRHETENTIVMGIGRNGATLGMLGMLIKDVMAPRAINHF